MTDFKYDTKLHEDARRCALSTYDEEKFTVPDSCKFLFRYTNPETGYYGIVYKRGDDFIIASRGTDWHKEWADFKRTHNIKSIQDVPQDIMMAAKIIPRQADDIMFLYNQCKDHGRVILTGDSLGGSGSAIIGILTGADAVVFNPFGVEDILKNNNIDYSKTDNIINYCNKDDIITGGNGDKHVGRIYEMKSKGHGIGLYDHFLENQQPIKEQKEISKYDLNLRGTIKKYHDKNKTRYIRGAFEFNNANPQQKQLTPQNVYYNPENNHSDIQTTIQRIRELQQRNFIDVPQQYNFNNETFGGYRAYNGGQVFVKEYKRKDGTIVKAHWRDWPENFDPNKKLVDMNEPELGHAIDFWLDEDKYA